MRFGLWCNWIFVALTAIGWLGIAHFWLPAGLAFFKSGPFAYHGLLAFYLPVVIWGAYIALTTWYMLKELKRVPDSSQIPATAEATPR